MKKESLEQFKTDVETILTKEFGRLPINALSIKLKACGWKNVVENTSRSALLKTLRKKCGVKLEDVYVHGRLIRIDVLLNKGEV